MAVKNVFQNGGRGDDLHVVNGAESMDLRTLLVINDSVVGAKFATTLPAGITLAFNPKFTNAPSPER